MAEERQRAAESREHSAAAEAATLRSELLELRREFDLYSQVTTASLASKSEEVRRAPRCIVPEQIEMPAVDI